MLLIADTKPKRGRDLADMLRWMGIVAVAARPIEALNELDHSVSAVLIVNPSELADVEDYISRVRSYSRKAPIFALRERNEKILDEGLFSHVFSSDIMTSTLIEGIRRVQAHTGHRPLGDYIFAGVDASCTHDEVLCLGERVMMTPRQKMILRYLFSAYPARVSPDEIAKHIYRPGTEPECSCIRAHICAINKKLRPILGRPLIDALRSSGYRILTAESLREKEKGALD